MRRDALGWLVLGVLVAVAVLTAGWGSDAPARPADGPSTPSVSPTREPVPDAHAADEAVATVLLRAADLPGGFDALPARTGGGPGPDGALADPAHLDLCGTPFAADEFLVARRVTRWVASGVTLTHQVLAYGPRRAVEAMHQTRVAAVVCPRGPAPHRLGGVLSLTRRYTVVPREAAWQRDAVAVVSTVSDAAGHTHRAETVFQRRGDVVGELTVDPLGPGTADLLRRTAATLGARMTAYLPREPAS